MCVARFSPKICCLICYFQLTTCGSAFPGCWFRVFKQIIPYQWIENTFFVEFVEHKPQKFGQETRNTILNVVLQKKPKKILQFWQENNKKNNKFLPSKQTKFAESRKKLKVCWKIYFKMFDILIKYFVFLVLCYNNTFVGKISISLQYYNSILMNKATWSRGSFAFSQNNRNFVQYLFSERVSLCKHLYLGDRFQNYCNFINISIYFT